MFKVFMSFLLTVGVSSLFGMLYMENFLKVFLITTIIQFVGFYIFNSIYGNILKIRLEQIKQKQFDELNKNVATVECPCDEKQKQPVDIRFDRKVFYKCNKCNKDIKVEPFVNTYLKTDPIYFDEQG